MYNERRIFNRFQARFPAKFKDTRGDFGNDPLVLSGRVMWTRPINQSSMWDIGLQFDEVDFMKMRSIFKYV
jgi:hypothetical protein